MKNIFVYGTLMYAEVWRRVAHKDYPWKRARLHNYQRYRVKNALYPGLVKSRNGLVEGVAYFGVEHGDIQRLDRFEGDYYQRLPVIIEADEIGRCRAEVYIFRNRYRRCLSGRVWRTEEFGAKAREKFLAGYRGFY